MKLSDVSLEKRVERMVFLSFIYSLALFATSFFVSYVACQALSGGTSYSLTDPICTSDTLSFIYSVARAMIPSAVSVTLVFLSAVTPLGSALSTVCLMWRGACLGCSVSMIASRALIAASRWAVGAIILYFLASVLIFILASLATVYRKMMAYAYASDEYHAVFGTTFDLFKLFLVISGAIYTLSLISIILLHTR